jgi:hypothetical protein
MLHSVGILRHSAATVNVQPAFTLPTSYTLSAHTATSRSLTQDPEETTGCQNLSIIERLRRLNVK